MATVTEYYNEEYFEKYQKKTGEFGGMANKFKFQDEIKETDSVLDFGCGGGFLLNDIMCKHKTGIEINEVTRKHYLSLGIYNLKSLPRAHGKPFRRHCAIVLEDQAGKQNCYSDTIGQLQI